MPRGLRVLDPEVAHAGPRALMAVAQENVREGCVRETIGAALALAAAARASTADDRAFYAAIASDELEHAAWSWEVDAWARSHMDASGRASLDAARREVTEGYLGGLDPADLPGVSPGLAGDLRALARALATEIGDP
jgi:hypothetical protein